LAVGVSEPAVWRTFLRDHAEAIAGPRRKENHVFHKPLLIALITTASSPRLQHVPSRGLRTRTASAFPSARSTPRGPVLMAS